MGLALACSRPAVPNVLLVTLDTARGDRFGCTGDPEARTPVVDALAARGLLFTRAFASVALTLPAHTTILTGLEPIVHGVHDNGRFRVPDDLDTRALAPAHGTAGRAGSQTKGRRCAASSGLRDPRGRIRPDARHRPHQGIR